MQITVNELIELLGCLQGHKATENTNQVPKHTPVKNKGITSARSQVFVWLDDKLKGKEAFTPTQLTKALPHLPTSTVSTCLSRWYINHKREYTVEYNESDARRVTYKHTGVEILATPKSNNLKAIPLKASQPVKRRSKDLLDLLEEKEG